MFTQLREGPPARMGLEEVWEYLQFNGVTAIELVPSLLWGEGWDFELDPPVKSLPPVGTVQSLFFGLPLLLSQGRLQGSEKAAWADRLEKIRALSNSFPEAVFVLGAPSMRKKASGTEQQALENFQKRVEEVAGVLERNSLLAIENCGTHQGADFCIGLESAARMVGKCDSKRLGVNLDLESALAEGFGRLPAENVWESLDSLGTRVHSIQLGVSALGPHRSWIECVLEIASSRGTVRTVAIEDSKFLDHSDLQAAVRVARDALGLSF
jgi:hypothetical protein